MRLEIRYPFLHPGLMRGLICDAGALAGESGVYWKYGVWAYDSQSGACILIEVHAENAGVASGRIVARLQGDRPERLAGWLRERFAEHHRRFGYTDLEPDVDELPRSDRRGLPVAEVDGPAPTTSPTFAPLPPTSFPPRAPEVFLSYAWADETPEGQRRGVAVEQIDRAFHAAGVQVRRDQRDLLAGARVTEFMNRLIAGDLIVAIISDRYLRSASCMYELHGIFRRCGSEPTRFLGRVIPLVLPDARISARSERLDYARYWKKEKERLDVDLRELGADYVGPETYRDCRLIGEFARDVADMLTLLQDKLVPRDLNALERAGYRPLIDLVGRSTG